MFLSLDLSFSPLWECSTFGTDWNYYSSYCGQMSAMDNMNNTYQVCHWVRGLWGHTGDASAGSHRSTQQLVQGLKFHFSSLRALNTEEYWKSWKPHVVLWFVCWDKEWRSSWTPCKSTLVHKASWRCRLHKNQVTKKWVIPSLHFCNLLEDVVLGFIYKEIEMRFSWKHFVLCPLAHVSHL